MTGPKDLTWPICIGCRHRVLRPVTCLDNEGKTWVEEAWVCALGMDRDRNPNWCPNKEHKLIDED